VTDIADLRDECEISEEISEEIELSVRWTGPILFPKRDIWGKTISPFAAPDDAYSEKRDAVEPVIEEASYHSSVVEMTEEERQRKATLKYEGNRMAKENDLQRPLTRFVDTAFEANLGEGNKASLDAFGFPILKQQFRDFPYCGTKEPFLRKDSEQNH